MHVPEALPHHELAVARELEHVKDKLLELDAVVGGRLLGGVGLGVVEGDLLVRHVLRQFLEVLPGGDCIKIGLPGKLILSKKKGLQEVLQGDTAP